LIYLEELVDVILAEEGQVLMGIDFILDDLKLSMKKLEAVFVKSAREYSRRRPIEETRNFEVASTMLQLPSNVTAVRAVRFGVLDSMPRFFMPTLGQSGYEFERHTGILKVWPPISPIRVTYTREVEIKGSQSIELTYPMDSGEDTLEEVLPTTFKSGTLTITKTNAKDAIAKIRILIVKTAVTFFVLTIPASNIAKPGYIKTTKVIANST
jgi:hypothetical protein